MFFSCGEVDRVSVAVADEQAVELLCTAAIFIVNDAISPLFCDLKQVRLFISQRGSHRFSGMSSIAPSKTIPEILILLLDKLKLWMVK